MPRAQKTKHVLFYPGFSDPLVSISRISKMPASGDGGEGKGTHVTGKNKNPPQETKHIICLASHVPPGLNDRLIFY